MTMWHSAANMRNNHDEDCIAAYHDLDREWTVKYAARLSLPNKTPTN